MCYVNILDTYSACCSVCYCDSWLTCLSSLNVCSWSWILWNNFLNIVKQISKYMFFSSSWCIFWLMRLILRSNSSSGKYPKRCTIYASHSPNHTHIHTSTAIGCHARYQPARQEQLGVRCLAQGHFNTPRVGSNRQPSDCQTTALTSWAIS